MSNDDIISDVQAAILAGQSVNADVRSIDGVPIAITPPGFRVDALDWLQRCIDERAENPRARQGHVVMTEAASFVEFVNRHKEPRSVVFADDTSLQAVFDYHPAGDDPSLAGWCRFTATYSVTTSDEWNHWTETEGDTMSQDTFADFIDEHAADIIGEEGYPKAIEMLEMARNLSIRTKGRFTRMVNATTGEYSMVCEQEHGSESTKIPRAFVIGIPVFEGGDRYRIECRVAFKLESNVARFSFKMHRRPEVYRDAFGDCIKAVKAAVGLPVFMGRRIK